jgi:hypothetical protein
MDVFLPPFIFSFWAATSFLLLFQALSSRQNIIWFTKLEQKARTFRRARHKELCSEIQGKVMSCSTKLIGSWDRRSMAMAGEVTQHG